MNLSPTQRTILTNLSAGEAPYANLGNDWARELQLLEKRGLVHRHAAPWSAGRVGRSRLPAYGLTLEGREALAAALALVGRFRVTVEIEVEAASDAEAIAAAMHLTASSPAASIKGLARCATAPAPASAEAG